MTAQSSAGRTNDNDVKHVALRGGLLLLSIVGLVWDFSCESYSTPKHFDLGEVDPSTLRLLCKRVNH